MTDTIIFDVISSIPLSPIWLAVSQVGLVMVDFQDDQSSFIQVLQHRFPNCQIATRTSLSYESKTQPKTLATAMREVSAYLAGKIKGFSVPLDWSYMTPFQERALRATCLIPYGQVATYQEIAHLIGSPLGARAVGRSEATNPIPLVIPCHRVIGSDGKLHGYGGRGGLQTKAWLLEMEKQNR